jgi:hypothetical protein
MARFFKWLKLKFHKCTTYPDDILWGLGIRLSKTKKGNYRNERDRSKKKNE